MPGVGLPAGERSEASVHPIADIPLDAESETSVAQRASAATSEGGGRLRHSVGWRRLIRQVGLAYQP